MGSDRLDGESVRSTLFFSNGNNLVTSIERECIGYIVRCLKQIRYSVLKTKTAIEVSKTYIQAYQWRV